jgi:hypothetical protein
MEHRMQVVLGASICVSCLKVDASEVLALCKGIAFSDGSEAASRQHHLLNVHIVHAQSLLFQGKHHSGDFSKAWSVLEHAKVLLEELLAQPEKAKDPWYTEASGQVYSLKLHELHNHFYPQSCYGGSGTLCVQLAQDIHCQRLAIHDDR